MDADSESAPDAEAATEDPLAEPASDDEDAGDDPVTLGDADEESGDADEESDDMFSFVESGSENRQDDDD
ncbi:hypothetical protein [Natronoarchaeum sp. GCM10025703]